MHGISVAECAIRMARAGANVVGVNCHFDPWGTLAALGKMKAGLEAAGLHHTTYLMCQPLGYHCPDAGRQGWKFMSCCHCQELCQQASWLLIGCTRGNNQSEARSVR